MTRILFSVYKDDVDEHSSVPQHNRDQFQKYKPHILKRQKDYAEQCGAEYRLITPDESSYQDIQHFKILQFEEFRHGFDEVVYLDFDAIPNKIAPNIFETLDFSKINMLPVHRRYATKEWDAAMEYDQFDHMNVYIKICAKKAMMMYDDFPPGEDYAYNTGVMAAGKDALAQLKYGERLSEMKEILISCRDDSIFPVQISKRFTENNEAFMTYLIERYDDIPYHNMSMAWNFIADTSKTWFKPTVSRSNSYIIHHVGKEFRISFDKEEFDKFKLGYGCA